MKKPQLGFWSIWNISFGFFGIQIGFALQNANVSRIFQSLGASIEALPILWIAGPVTGLLVQPLIGHFSDRTWTRLGRRRPYFLAGAVLTALALILLPNASILWFAVLAFWLLDASINVAMEPFRAFVGDMLPKEQRTRGFAMQGVFIGGGALLASLAPYVLTNVFGVANTAPEGVVPDAVKFSFYLGAIALASAIFWTVFTTKEYSPEQLEEFARAEGVTALHPPAERARPTPEAFSRFGFIALIVGLACAAAVIQTGGDKQLLILAGALVFLGIGFLIKSQLQKSGRDDNFLGSILDDLMTMPPLMRQLAVVQFFSWFGLFIMWVYSTPAVAAWHFGSTDASSEAFGAGANWVGVMFAVYNGVAMIYCFVLPRIAAAIGQRTVHAVNLCCGAAGLGSYLLVRDPNLLLLSMVGIGMAWASILTMPYAILCGALPPAKMGVYMGIFNFFIVLPQITVAGVMGPIVRIFLGGEAIYALLFGALTFLAAAAAMAFVASDQREPAARLPISGR